MLYFKFLVYKLARLLFSSRQIFKNTPDGHTSRFHVNACGSLLAIITINTAVIGVSVITYEVRKVVILWNQNLQMDTDKIRKISETKQFVFRNLFPFSRT
jgi:hypothetical protein